MQTLVSTRLFENSPLEGRALRLLLERGFLTLELLATPERLDLRSPSRARLLRRQLEMAGLRAPWIYMDESYLPLLGRELRFEELTATLLAFKTEALVIPRAAWATPRSQAALLELRSYAQRAGTRLLADAESLGDRPVVASPEIGICWDVAFLEESEREAEESRLDELPRWRLQGVRLAHGRDGFRAPPGERQALLLEDLWPRLAPRTLVYDVETTGSEAELRRTIEEIRAFHSGERRPADRRGGGLFWASLAPG